MKRQLQTVLDALVILRSFLHERDEDKPDALPQAPSYYTSRGPLPPGVSRRRFNELARNVRDSRKDGRAWVVPADSWAQYRNSSSRGQVVGSGARAETSAWSAQDALRRAGIVDLLETPRMQ